MALIPPFRFACVEDGLYRGAYPTLKNFSFLRRLHLKTVVSLIPESPTLDLHEFCAAEGIENVHIHVLKPNETLTLTHAIVKKVLELLLEPQNLPLYLHCLDGCHVTGLIIMCLRKLQNWNFTVIFSEFARFNNDTIISKETQFFNSMSGPVCVPARPVHWLWQGLHVQKHPNIKIREQLLPDTIPPAPLLKVPLPLQPSFAPEHPFARFYRARHESSLHYDTLFCSSSLLLRHERLHNALQLARTRQESSKPWQQDKPQEEEDLPLETTVDVPLHSLMQVRLEGFEGMCTLAGLGTGGRDLKRLASVLVKGLAEPKYSRLLHGLALEGRTMNAQMELKLQLADIVSKDRDFGI